MDVDNGIMQGDPLSMILYLFYNADFIENIQKEELKIAYVDDVNFYAEGADFEEVYTKLGDMMVREGGGQDWSHWHNSQFELSKLTLVGFSQWRVLDPANPSKLRPKPRRCGHETSHCTQVFWSTLQPGAALERPGGEDGCQGYKVC